jgi:predicted transcriptional regulator
MKKELLREFMRLLNDNGTNLKDFCAKNELNYNTVYQKLSRYNINIDEVNELIQLIDNTKRLKIIICKGE